MIERLESEGAIEHYLDIMSLNIKQTYTLLCQALYSNLKDTLKVLKKEH